MEFTIMVQAKAGNKEAVKKLWNTYFKDRQNGESALLLVRKIEEFNPGKVINRAGWKFSELLAK